MLRSAIFHKLLVYGRNLALHANTFVTKSILYGPLCITHTHTGPGMPWASLGCFLIRCVESYCIMKPRLTLHGLANGRVFRSEICMKRVSQQYTYLSYFKARQKWLEIKTGCSFHDLKQWLKVPVREKTKLSALTLYLHVQSRKPRKLKYH